MYFELFKSQFWLLSREVLLENKENFDPDKTLSTLRSGRFWTQTEYNKTRISFRTE